MKNFDKPHPCFVCGCMYIGEGVVCSNCDRGTSAMEERKEGILTQIMEILDLIIEGTISFIGLIASVF